MRRAVLAEWTKLRTVPSTAWLLLAVVAGTVALSTLVAWAADPRNCPPPQPACRQDTVRLSLAGVYLGQLAVVVLAVLAVGAEYGTGTIRATFAAYPRRVSVLAAKAVVVVTAAVVAGLCGVLGSFAAGRILLPDKGFTPAQGYPPLSLADPGTLRAILGTVLYLALVALVSLGVATAVRDTAFAIAAMLALLFVLPILAFTVSDAAWRDRILSYAPMPAGLGIQATVHLDRLPIGPWAGVGVLAGYAAAALVLGAVLLQFRDA